MKLNIRSTAIRHTLSIILLILVGGISACKKLNEQPINYKVTPTPFSNSQVRLIRQNGYYADLIISGRALTNLVSPSNNTKSVSTPTRYFPDNGKWDGVFTIPDSLFINNKAEVKIVSSVGVYSSQNTFLHDSLITVYDTVLTNKPSDIYFRRGQLTYYRAPFDVAYKQNGYYFTRDVIPPADPTHFKIRIINLFDKDGNISTNGSVSLTYANGSAVSAGNSNIFYYGGSGAYADLSYGTYQFHVFYNSDYNSGFQLLETPLVGSDDNYLNTVDTRIYAVFNAIRTQLHTFQPGGIYTVVAGLDNSTYQVMADNSASNINYARLQFVNALPGKNNPDIRVDGHSIGNLNFGAASDYGIYSKGTHQIDISYQGKTLYQENITLNTADAITLWAYEDTRGYNLLYTNTDMGINIYNYLSGNDNKGKTLVLPQAIQIRFLNLAPDAPYITFTNNDALFQIDTNPINDAGVTLSANKNTQLLPFAKVITDTPYVRIISENNIPRTIKAYQNIALSAALPGTLLSNVTPLQTPFVANLGMYNPSQFYSGLPAGEPGVYSVALIGKVNSTNAAESAKLIFVKHNK